jgi:hypothetical protein
MDSAELLAREGSYYVGDKGVLLLGRVGMGKPGEGLERNLLPAAKFKDFASPPKAIQRTVGHYREWIEAAKGGPPANCNFDFASTFAETALLGVISTRTGKHLLWDAENMRITNDAGANQYISPPYRSGWSL